MEVTILSLFDTRVGFEDHESTCSNLFEMNRQQFYRAQGFFKNRNRNKIVGWMIGILVYANSLSPRSSHEPWLSFPMHILPQVK